VFGSSADQYSRGRKEFPAEIIDFVTSPLGDPRLVLDLGCGTGIATRQLAARGHQVIGCDRDVRMLSEARSQPCHGTSYVVGSAEQVPFSPQQFDLTTAFSAFHWFTNDQAFAEICRTLKPNGWLAVVNKTEAGDFETRLRQVLRPFAFDTLPNAKEGYRPKAFLRGHHVSNLQAISIPREERFDYDRAISFLGSQSIWNAIPEECRRPALGAVETWILSEIAERGAFVRQITVEALVCRPNASSRLTINRGFSRGEEAA